MLLSTWNDKYNHWSDALCPFHHLDVTSNNLLDVLRLLLCDTSPVATGRQGLAPAQHREEFPSKEIAFEGPLETSSAYGFLTPIQL